MNNFLAKVMNSKDMPIMLNTLHKTTAFHIQRELKIEIEPFWYQY